MNDELEQILTELFEKGLDAGSDVTLDRQFENDPDLRTRYIKRCTKEAVAALTTLAAERERLAETSARFMLASEIKMEMAPLMVHRLEIGFPVMTAEIIGKINSKLEAQLILPAQLSSSKTGENVEVITRYERGKPTTYSVDGGETYEQKSKFNHPPTNPSAEHSKGKV